jgi:uncharacterized membrane protein YoaK (UPF0700 family)
VSRPARRDAPRPNQSFNPRRAVTKIPAHIDKRDIRDLLLVALTISTGAVDALSWLGLGKVFSAFMTGNIAFLGFRVGGAPGPSVPRVLATTAAFAFGAFLGARIVRRTENSGGLWPRRAMVSLAVALVFQAAFLVLWAAVNGHPSTASGDVLVALSGVAMGMQTTTIFSLGVRADFTTAATATLAVLMGDLAGWSQTRGERRRLAATVIGLFIGAVTGGVLMVNARTWAPVFPLVVTGLVVAAVALVFERGQSWGRRSARDSRRVFAAGFRARPTK